MGFQTLMALGETQLNGVSACSLAPDFTAPWNSNPP
jgi:hypothetical protein